MVLNAWKRVHHPNIIALRNCYLSNGAVFFVHDFYPTATSLYDCFLKVLLSLFSLIPTERPAWLRSAPRRPSLVHRHPAALRPADHPRLQSRLSHHGLSPRPHDRAKPLPDRQCRRDGHCGAVFPDIKTLAVHYSEKFVKVMQLLLSAQTPASAVLEQCTTQIVKTLNSSLSTCDTYYNDLVE